MRMGQGVRTGLGHRGITCVLQTQFSSFVKFCGHKFCHLLFRAYKDLISRKTSCFVNKFL